MSKISCAAWCALALILGFLAGLGFDNKHHKNHIAFVVPLSSKIPAVVAQPGDDITWYSSAKQTNGGLGVKIKFEESDAGTPCVGELNPCVRKEPALNTNEDTINYRYTCSTLNSNGLEFPCQDPEIGPISISSTNLNDEKLSFLYALKSNFAVFFGTLPPALPPTTNYKLKPSRYFNSGQLSVVCKDKNSVIHGPDLLEAKDFIWYPTITQFSWAPGGGTVSFTTNPQMQNGTQTTMLCDEADPAKNGCTKDKGKPPPGKYTYKVHAIKCATIDAEGSITVPERLQ